MKKFYSGENRFSYFKTLPLIKIFGSILKSGLCLATIFLLLITFSNSLAAQTLEFSYSYFNLTRNSGGGNLEQGDTIEIHALVKINATTYNFYYMDTMRTGTQYIPGSMQLITNEGVVVGGPYSDAGNDDEGTLRSTDKIRINLGSGASNAKNTSAGFGSATGGGTVNPGDVPKFYGSTLFVVSYKLKITANNGDTIHPSGIFYFDTTSSAETHNKSYSFNYAGIKITQNQALCNNFSSASFTADSSFGAGNTQNRVLAADVPGYIKINIGANAPGDNYYSIANNTSADGTTNNAGSYKPTTNTHRVFGGFWDIIGDHTGAASTSLGNPPPAAGTNGGYMLVVNAAFTTGEAYRDTIKNVCPNTYYEFSTWVRNICKVCGIDLNSNPTYTPGVKPNLSFAINDVDYYTTGNITYDGNWVKRGFIYKTGPAETQFRITIKNNAAGGGGNDWVIDDIKLATCYPNLVNSPKDTATSCKGFPLTLSDTVKSYFNNYTNFCWEKSTDGMNWISTGVCGTKTPVLVNGLWQYVVDTSFTTVASDNGTYYRLKVGTTFSNLSDPTCSVNNSQRIYLKVFSSNCTVLQTKILNFYGNYVGDKSILKWSSQNEKNLLEYDVEKSTDGVNFSQVGVVFPLNSVNETKYIFNDPASVSSYVYYRLKLISQENNKYSDIIMLYNKTAPFRVSYINPFKNNLKLNVFIPEDGVVKIHLYNIYGKAVSKKSVQLTKGNSKVILDDVETLPAGIYILRIFFNNTISQAKLFKTN
jgi:hypothetical protein